MCRHYDHYLTEEERYFVNSPEDNNCVLCLIDRKGPMSQEEVGRYLGLTKMRISQIQKIAEKKLNIRIKFGL
jgi:DNA-directed RNA polymerase sigma subunit (sigma70/sigma32)